VDRQPGDLAAEIPEGEIDGGQNPVGEGGQVEALALLEAVPELLAVEVFSILWSGPLRSSGMAHL
jgi:hypothetical protein